MLMGDRSASCVEFRRSPCCGCVVRPGFFTCASLLVTDDFPTASSTAVTEARQTEPSGTLVWEAMIVKLATERLLPCQLHASPGRRQLYEQHN